MQTGQKLARSGGKRADDDPWYIAGYWDGFAAAIAEIFPTRTTLLAADGAVYGLAQALLPSNHSPQPELNPFLLPQAAGVISPESYHLQDFPWAIESELPHPFWSHHSIDFNTGAYHLENGSLLLVNGGESL